MHSICIADINSDTFHKLVTPDLKFNSNDRNYNDICIG